MDIVDAQVHLNRLGSNWEHTEHAVIVHYAVATMDALGLGAILSDEWAGFYEPVTKRRHLQGRVLPNGTMRGEHRFRKPSWHCTRTDSRTSCASTPAIQTSSD